MDSFNDTLSIHPDARVGTVRLTVRDAGRMKDYYTAALGLAVSEDAPDGSSLAAHPGSLPLFRLFVNTDAMARNYPAVGLFHTAVLFPSRNALASALRRVIAMRVPIDGFADHGVSEAVYLTDPEGNGLELYCDKPISEWQRKGDTVEMFTEPLDVEALLESAGEYDPLAGPDSGARIGHIHLSVSSLKRSEEFYQGLLGFGVTQRTYPGALFLAAGGYHHHIGLNVWRSRNAPPLAPGAVGLQSFSVTIPDADSFDRMRRRLAYAGGIRFSGGETRDEETIFLHDPDGIGVELVRIAPKEIGS